MKKLKVTVASKKKEEHDMKREIVVMRNLSHQSKVGELLEEEILTLFSQP